MLRMTGNVATCGNGSEMIGSRGGFIQYNEEEV